MSSGESDQSDGSDNDASSALDEYYARVQRAIESSGASANVARMDLDDADSSSSDSETYEQSVVRRIAWANMQRNAELAASSGTAPTRSSLVARGDRSVQSGELGAHQQSRVLPTTSGRAPGAAAAAAAAPAAAHTSPAAKHSAAASAAMASSASAPRPAIARPAQRGAFARASAAIQTSSSRRGATTNYPPSDAHLCSATATHRQIYRKPHEADYGLSINSQILRTHVQLSQVLSDGKAGLGLWASRDFAEGEVVGYLWGKFVTQEVWDTIQTRHQDNTFRAGEEDYVAPVQRGIHRVVRVDMQEDGATILLASEQCPAAYINQGHVEATNNVEFRYPRHAFDPASERDIAYTYFPVAVKTIDGRGVRAGEEFTTDYGWTAASLAELQEQYEAHQEKLLAAPASRLRGQYDSMRASRQHFPTGPSSVVTNPTDDNASPSSSSSSASPVPLHLRRQKALEQPDRCFWGNNDSPMQYTCCKQNCFELTSHSWVASTRTQFTKMSSEQRAAHVQTLCSSVEKVSVDKGLRMQHTYRVRIDDVATRVCHRFWTDIYQVANEFLERVRTSELVPRQRVELKTEAIRQWFSDMELMHEFQPDTVGAGRASAADAAAPFKRKTGVLLSYARKQDVYTDYADEARAAGQGDAVASLTLFMTVWYSYFPHVKLRKHSRFAKCDDCVRLRGLLRISQGDRAPGRGHRGDSRAANEFRLHLTDIKAERAYYHSKRREARDNPADILSIILDGADQGSYGYPHFPEQSKTSSGMFKQKYHLIGALVHGRGAWVYTMSHRFPADPNVTIEVLQRVLTDLSNESGGPLPKKLYLQLDNCVRENKNRALMAYLSWLVQRGVFAEIHVSFLPVGHTHEDIDQVWSRTSLAMKGSVVCCDEELFDVIKKSFQHNGHVARCESLKSVANIKEWLLGHCEEMAGLAGREILHLKIVNHKDGPAIYTKHRAGSGTEDNWSEPGHLYQTESKGFHLLHKDTPAPPFKNVAGRPDVEGPPPLQPSVQSKTLLTRLEKALGDCRSEARVTPVAFASLMASLDELKMSEPVPFQWADDGQLLCEREPVADVGHRLQLPAIDAQAAEHQRYVEHLAEEEDARRIDAAAQHASDSDSDEGNSTEEEDDPRQRLVPKGLRTREEETLRKQLVLDAQSESHFSVSSLAAGHFVVFTPKANERPAAASGDDRQFWVGRVYADWEEKGVRYSGINRDTGVISVRNYTPYNVQKGRASSNHIAGQYGSYTPEYDTKGGEQWMECHWTQVLFVLSHLIPHVDNPAGELSPDRPSFFKLPKYLQNHLKSIYENAVAPPKRTMREFVFRGPAGNAPQDAQISSQAPSRPAACADSPEEGAQGMSRAAGRRRKVQSAAAAQDEDQEEEVPAGKRSNKGARRAAARPKGPRK